MDIIIQDLGHEVGGVFFRGWDFFGLGFFLWQVRGTRAWGKALSFFIIIFTRHHHFHAYVIQNELSTVA